MIIISSRKFRENQNEFFKKALEEEVVLKTLHFGSFRLMPVSEDGEAKTVGTSPEVVEEPLKVPEKKTGWAAIAEARKLRAQAAPTDAEPVAEVQPSEVVEDVAPTPKPEARKFGNKQQKRVFSSASASWGGSGGPAAQRNFDPADKYGLVSPDAVAEPETDYLDTSSIITNEPPKYIERKQDTVLDRVSERMSVNKVDSNLYSTDVNVRRASEQSEAAKDFKNEMRVAEEAKNRVASSAPTDEERIMAQRRRADEARKMQEARKRDLASQGTVHSATADVSKEAAMLLKNSALADQKRAAERRESGYDSGVYIDPSLQSEDLESQMARIGSKSEDTGFFGRLFGRRK